MLVCAQTLFYFFPQFLFIFFWDLVVKEFQKAPNSSRKDAWPPCINCSNWISECLYKSFILHTHTLWSTLFVLLVFEEVLIISYLWYFVHPFSSLCDFFRSGHYHSLASSKICQRFELPRNLTWSSLRWLLVNGETTRQPRQRRWRVYILASFSKLEKRYIAFCLTKLVMKGKSCIYYKVEMG